MTKSNSKNTNIEEETMNTQENGAEETTASEQEAAAESSVESVKVTSTQTVDFPSLGWGIHQGEERDLPDDADARATILSNPYISIIKSNE